MSGEQLPLPLPPTERERRARIWLWCAHLMGVEEDAILYHRDYGLRLRKAEELEMLASARRAFVAKADEVGGEGYTDRAWAEALEAFRNRTEDPA